LAGNLRSLPPTSQRIELTQKGLMEERGLRLRRGPREIKGDSGRGSASNVERSWGGTRAELEEEERFLIQ